MYKNNSPKSSSPFSSNGIWPTTDIHAHLLPGIDDGPATTEDALYLIEKLFQLGYRRLVATPHIMNDLYPNTTDQVSQTYEEFLQEIKKHDIPIELSCAAEYFMDESFEELMESDDLLTFHGRYILIEMSTFAIFPKYHEYIFKLKTKGYKPVLAHPERYTYFHNNLDAFEGIKNMGCLFQVNILSLQGYYGKKIKTCAQQLIENNMVNFLGTDVHHSQHIKKLTKALASSKIKHLLANYSFQNDQL